MDRLVFCRKAKELVRNIIRGWYRLEITSDGLLRAADRSSFTWIGVNSREYLPGLSGETLRERLRRMQASPVPLLMDREKYFFQPVTDRFCCILAEYRLSTDPKSGLILSETQRATFCILLEGEDLRVCHIHASNAVRPGGTARNSTGRTGEYMYELRMREELGEIPGLTERQRTVLYLLAEGLSYRAIAEALQITPRTVRYYVAELCRRLSAENRAQLIAATRRGRNRSGGGGRRKKQTKSRLCRPFFMPAFPACLNHLLFIENILPSKECRPDKSAVTGGSSLSVYVRKFI